MISTRLFVEKILINYMRPLCTNCKMWLIFTCLYMWYFLCELGFTFKFVISFAIFAILEDESWIPLLSSFYVHLR